MDISHEVVFCIVNEGFSEVVMDAAKRAGARGGTVLRARGTANVDAEKFFGISITPQKEIVMILVPAEIRNDVLHNLYSMCGLDTPGHGIAFALPVDQVIGIKQPDPAATAASPDAAPAASPASSPAAEQEAPEKE
ncbi:MAG: P-II family nitrogen regulator [Clostridia bacterium]|nr:P-II family nitrogen regulator [Clostridia bacterium]